MNKRIFKDASNQPLNPQLEDLESVQQKVSAILEEKDAVIKSIRDGFVDAVVVFVDLVDSTKYKIENEKEPEKWILRVKQFGDIIKEYIEQSNGTVVKYIGDEVMGIFDKKTQIDDALGLIVRIKNIEKNLTKITGAKTQVKIALDYGKVFLIKYEGHDELDPQGTPIDRCARIGQYCRATTILSSYEFVSKGSFPKHWFKLGIVEMKGLGNQPIYQYGEQTIEIQKKIEVTEEELNLLKETKFNLNDENQSLQLDKKELVSTIKELQEQLKSAGEKPIIETDFSEESKKEQEENDWEEIRKNFTSIRKLIKDSGVHESEYARFLFLYQKGMDEEYNSFKGKEFDDVIEKNLVIQNSDERFELNGKHKRNQKLIQLIDRTEKLLEYYVGNYGEIDEDDLFEYSFTDADFWSNYLNIYVL